jgi:hypothetical protein
MTRLQRIAATRIDFLKEDGGEEIRRKLIYGHLIEQDIGGRHSYLTLPGGSGANPAVLRSQDFKNFSIVLETLASTQRIDLKGTSCSELCSFPARVISATRLSRSTRTTLYSPTRPSTRTISSGLGTLLCKRSDFITTETIAEPTSHPRDLVLYARAIRRTFPSLNSHRCRYW